MEGAARTKKVSQCLPEALLWDLGQFGAKNITNPVGRVTKRLDLTRSVCQCRKSLAVSVESQTKGIQYSSEIVKKLRVFNIQIF